RGGNSSKEQEAHHSHNYYAIFYSVLIFAIVFGNMLVCLAVLREKSLQTTTNYLVVSLAIADLLVASLVMPWVVYLEVSGGVWMFSRVYCDLFVTLDVMMCTASILNLCAISIDRYTAVVMPVLYNSTQSSRRRVSLMITFVWILAFAVSSPLLFGLNTTEDPRICSISNPQFVIYSSVVSFYLPFVITLLVYLRIYVFLRKRRKRVSLRKSCGRIQPACVTTEVEKVEVLDQRCSIATSLRLRKQTTGPPDNTFLTPLELPNCCIISQASFAKSEVQDEGAEPVKESVGQLAKRASEVLNLPDGKTQISLRPSVKRRSLHIREKKATQMLAIVLGVFLICWLPFFVTHVLNTHCTPCYVPPGVYSATTWLGYVNSALNPVIYTIFNVEFRRAFVKILSC
ncbi:D(3) dopamine receptor, partial [Erpetoichthys calabaricus]|uniref:D(3) dopamine receptor n=1 Tax=Erpetoichthys calabaricus TaxID=27687 RepID=UPI0022349E2D